MTGERAELCCHMRFLFDMNDFIIWSERSNSLGSPFTRHGANLSGGNQNKPPIPRPLVNVSPDDEEDDDGDEEEDLCCLGLESTLERASNWFGICCTPPNCCAASKATGQLHLSPGIQLLGSTP